MGISGEAGRNDGRELPSPQFIARAGVYQRAASECARIIGEAGTAPDGELADETRWPLHSYSFIFFPRLHRKIKEKAGTEQGRAGCDRIGRSRLVFKGHRSSKGGG